jgi:DNA processing protein
VEDVLAELAPGLRPFLSPVAETVQEKNKRDENGPESLLKLVGFEPIPVDQLIQTSGLTAGQVSSMLLRLEIDGWLARCADGTIVRVR